MLDDRYLEAFGAIPEHEAGLEAVIDFELARIHLASRVDTAKQIQAEAEAIQWKLDRAILDVHEASDLVELAARVAVRTA